MTGTKTNERPGTRAVARNVRMSATKVRVVLDNVRGLSVDEARDVLAYTEREAAAVVGKLLESAVANAEHNDQIDPETLFVAACYADEGRTLYRFRPRARGRATRIRKRTCHVTMIVSPMSAQMLAVEQAKREAIPGSRASRRRGQEAASRAARVAGSQPVDDADELDDADVIVEDEATDVAESETAEVEETTENETTEVEETTAVEETEAEAPADADDTDEAAAPLTDAEQPSSDEAADDGTEEN